MLTRTDALYVQRSMLEYEDGGVGTPILPPTYAFMQNSQVLICLRKKYHILCPIPYV